ncbi:MAG: TlpA family protein disulfide reductase [Bacteroidetes bacterium]|nr:MAG: TlpA family protein disulfide reductase [Bacteroidota bacterium]
MKKLTVIALMVFLFTAGYSQVKEQKSYGKIPSVSVKTPTGETFNTADISNDGNPVIISFWATWCKPCIKELTTIADVYDEWIEDTGVKLIAVSIDDARASSKVMPLVNGKAWDYEVLLDANGDFKRAMNVNLIPHTFVIDGNGEIVWQHTSFSEGAELDLIEVVTKVKEGKDISGHE